jgi:hypothetical protein
MHAYRSIVVSCLRWAFLLLATSLWAQIPQIVEIPDSVGNPPLQELRTRRFDLVNRRTDLRQQAASHNGQCSSVTENTAEAQACNVRKEQLEGAIRSYSADVRKFNDDVARATSATAQPSPVVNKSVVGQIEQLRANLADLSSDVKKIQESLGQLNKSILGDQKERKSWEVRIAESSDRAERRAIHLTADEVLSVIGGVLASKLQEADSEIGLASKSLTGDTGSAQQQELQTTLQSWRQRKATIETTRVLLVDTSKRFNDRIEYVLNAAHERDATKATLEVAYGEIYAMLNDRNFQQILHFSEKYAVPVKWAKAAVDSTYDAASVGFAWRATYQFNQNVELYRIAVPKLQERMQSTMNKLQQAELELEYARMELSK